MTNYNTLGNKLKGRVLNYSKRISEGFQKPSRKFIADMIYGILSANNCKLTEISRALKEQIALKKTTERLGRNLSDFSEEDRSVLMADYIATIKASVGNETMLLVDGGDATKSCSPKMESIGIVRDSDTGEFANGYWTMGAVALSGENRQPIPVYENLYPCKKQGGLGTNAETLKCLQYLRQHFCADVPRVFDRGFDSKSNVVNLSENNDSFILRANQNRVAIHKGKRSCINDIAKRIACDYELAYTSKAGEKIKCKIGVTQVAVPSFNNLTLSLVVCKGFGEPLMLYTNIPETLDSIAVRIVKVYLLRWRIEEFYAFKKQGFEWEDFRVRSLNSIKSLDLLLTIAIGFIGTLGENIGSPLVIELIAISKRIQKICAYLQRTKFPFYAILSGVKTVFASLRCGISHYFSPATQHNQLSFAGFQILG